MSGKWPGGIISKTAPTVTAPTDGEGGSASGIWTLDQAADYEKQGLWPKPVIPKELWSWGRNQNGQLGVDNTTYYSSPVQVGALTNWRANTTAGGQYVSAAIKNDGTLWTWGQGTSGALGDGTTVTKSSPVQVGLLTNWATVTQMRHSTLAIKTDGTLWSWGANGLGQLGLGNTTYYSSPVQVGSLTTWSKISCGLNFVTAIKTDGTLWAWGRNAQGQLGQGNTTNKSSPVQVGLLTDWSQLGDGKASCFALKTDGTLWAWGDNGYGVLGDGTSTDRSSPVQIGSLTTWSQLVSAGQYHCGVVKTDGTLWTWGRNTYGQVGDGTTTNRSSPVQVGALTTWSRFRGALHSSMGLTTGGTLWTWGYNNRGQLGQGNTTNYSSPVQVGALTTWSGLAAQPESEHSLATKTV
tara:strand:+ start:132 stop:1355 length:1224 start_codon:yes stop_codon:yes gene_type:complete